MLLVCLAAGAVTLLSGCAATAPDPRDPLESINRATYKLNDALDKAVLKPVAQGYNAVLPQPVRNCVGNVFGNIGDLYTGVNNLLEGYPGDAGSDVCRVAVNTTVGVLGCFDVASGMGFTKHKKDFGLTLGVWGVQPGAYIVLPFFGPSDVRDTAGLVADLYADPVGYLYPVWQRNIIEGVRIIDTRASFLGAGNLLQGAALDEYVFVRDGWFTRRRSQVYNGNPPDEVEPDADEGASAPAGPTAAPATAAPAK
jgi:phospholipid-binding lipoprotein MlaA